MVKHPNGNTRMTVSSVDYMRPLLQQIPFIERVSCGNFIPQGALQLDRFRNVLQNTKAVDLRTMYYDALWDSPEMPQVDYYGKLYQTRRVIPHIRGNIAVCVSQRVLNPLVSFSGLKCVEQRCIFVGLTKQWLAFRERSGLCNIRFFPVSDMLQLATVLNSVRLVIGNLTGNIALAEQMKVPRIIVPQDFTPFIRSDGELDLGYGVTNTNPVNRGMLVHSDQQLERIVKMMCNVK